MTTEELLKSVSKAFGPKIQRQTEFHGETTCTIAANGLREIAKFCRDELLFDYLIDVTSIDDFGEEPRFEIVYHLYSMPHAVHLRLKLKVPEDAGAADTISDIWPTANWHEREIYDMMGIRFNGHPDLRRILMWDGYPFFPLRKDFPLLARQYSNDGARLMLVPAWDFVAETRGLTCPARRGRPPHKLLDYRILATCRRANDRLGRDVLRPRTNLRCAALPTAAFVHPQGASPIPPS